MRSVPRIASLPLILLALLGVACEEDSPTFPDGPTLTFRGQLASVEEVDVQFFEVEVNGTFRVEMTELVLEDPNTGEQAEGVQLVVFLGTPDEDGECRPSLTNSLGEGDSFTVYLQAKEYCLSLRRIDTLPEEYRAEYVILMEPAFD